MCRCGLMRASRSDLWGATRIAVKRAGKFVEVGSTEQVLHQPRDGYTRELLAAVPTLPTRWTVGWAFPPTIIHKLTSSSRLG
jgi:ABC-type dipeptide/oligopeptide/nickel transport system ATPase component